MADSVAAEALAILKKALTDKGVVPQAIAFLCETQGCASLDDLVHMVSGDTALNDFKDIFDPIRRGDGALPQFNVQVGKIYSVWDVANVSHRAAPAASAVATPVVDMEAPLPEGITERLKANWKAIHGDLDFGPRISAADTLINRLWREITRNCGQVHAVEKLKSQLQSAIPCDQRRVAAGEVTMLINEDPSANVRGIVAYHFQSMILHVGYAYAGSEQVDSIRFPGTKVVCAPLSINVQYCSERLRIASTWNVLPARALQEYRSRDIVTRTAMITKMRLGWPQGEALAEALNETRSVWDALPLGSTSAAESFHVEGPGGASGGGNNGGNGGGNQNRGYQPNHNGTIDFRNKRKNERKQKAHKGRGKGGGHGGGKGSGGRGGRGGSSRAPVFSGKGGHK